MRYLLLAAAACIVAAPAVADTKSGVEAWQRGDFKTAVDEWRREARNGDADAEFNLAQAYKLGRGVPLDLQKAEELYGKAAKKGHPDASDYYGLTLFQNGKPRDAAPYLEKAAERGDPRAQYLLGTMLFNGNDVKRDWVRAYALTLKANDAGLLPAASSLKQMDQYIPEAQRQQGRVLAARMSGGARPADDRGETMVAGGYDSARPPVSMPGSSTWTPDETPAPVKKPVAVAAKPRPQTPAVAAAPSNSGRWRVQLGAFGDAGNARRLGNSLSGRFPGIEYVKAGAITRVMGGPFASKAAALAACKGISPCVPVER